MWARRLQLHPHVQSYIHNEESVSHSVVMNSLIAGEGQAGDHSVIEHSKLEGTWSIGSTSFVSQIRSFTDISVCDETAIQEVEVRVGENGERDVIVLCYGVKDSIKAQYGTPAATVCGQSWEKFFEVAGVLPMKVCDDDDCY